jgi:hypothetical protein
MTVIRGVLAFLIGLTLALALNVTFSHSQPNGHPPEHQNLHETFYSHWDNPRLRMEDGRRYSSCCGLKDCYPTEVSKRGDQIYARSHDGLRWVLVPSSAIEQNYPDEEESPDGQSHVCMNEYDVVFCFTLGTGM